MPESNLLKKSSFILLIIAGLVTLFLYLEAAYDSFQIGRYVFNFPTWTFGAVLNPFYYDRWRYGFLFFQIPNILISFFTGSEHTVDSFRASATSLNFMFQIHAPLVLIFILIDSLRKKAHTFLITFLTSFATLYLPAAAISFNGAPQCHSFFWLLSWLVYAYFDEGKFKSKSLSIFYYSLFVIFTGLYPPFSFTGAVALAILSFIKTRRLTPALIVHTLGAALVAYQLIYVSVTPEVYNFGETFFAVEATGLGWFPKMIIPAIFISTLMILAPWIRDRKVRIFWVFLLFSVLGLYIYFYTSWLHIGDYEFGSYPIYLKRIYVYTIAPLIAVILFLNRRKREYSQLTLMTSYLVVIVLLNLNINLERISNRVFSSKVNEAATIVANRSERCFRVEGILDVKLFEHFSFHHRDWPFYSLLLGDKLHGKFLYSETLSSLEGWGPSHAKTDVVERYCNEEESDDEKKIPIAHLFFRPPLSS